MSKNLQYCTLYWVLLHTSNNQIPFNVFLMISLLMQCKPWLILILVKKSTPLFSVFLWTQYNTHLLIWSPHTPIGLFKQKTHIWQVNSPRQASVVVAPIEELYLLKGLRVRQVGGDVWVEGKESVECSCACLLWTNHQEARQLLTRLVVWPDFDVPRIMARIL